MIVRITRNDTEDKVRVSMKRLHASTVLVDDNGTVYGSGDWFRMNGTVIRASPSERATLPAWMRAK